jgi:hypothetical protein
VVKKDIPWKRRAAKKPLTQAWAMESIDFAAFVHWQDCYDRNRVGKSRCRTALTRLALQFVQLGCLGPMTRAALDEVAK